MYPLDAYVRQNNGLSNHRFISDVVPQLKKSFYSFSNNLVVVPEIIYQDIHELHKYANSHILILGGGISLNKLDFNAIKDNYDFVWSMNGCYFNEKINNFGVDLLVIGCNTDILSQEFLSFTHRHNPTVAFELHCKYYLTPPRLSKEQLDTNIKTANDLSLNKMCFQVRWYSHLGTGVRQFILACILKPSVISFIGFDGRRDIINDKHAFISGDKNWENQNTIAGSIRGMNNEQVVHLMRYEYNRFWQYIKENFPNIKVFNLDLDNDYHIALGSAHV